jgi:acetyl esterase
MVEGPALAAPLDPRIRLWLKMAGWLASCGVYPTMESLPALSIERRKASKPPWWLNRPLPDDVDISDYPAGWCDLPYPVRVYRPAGKTQPLPLLLFLHGGGFVNGGVDSMQYTCAVVAGAASLVVVSLDYPLAPEAPYPAALDAAQETLAWLAEEGPRLGGTNVLAVMGDSAGGNLAAAVCLVARRYGVPPIRHQVLVYPALDATLSMPSMRAAEPERRRDCELFYSYYASKASRDEELLSPLLAADLSGLPSATIVTADHDALRDDGLVYARRLEQAGVRVRVTNYLGMPHGFLSMPRLCRAVPQALAEIVSQLGQLHEPA